MAFSSNRLAFSVQLDRATLVKNSKLCTVERQLELFVKFRDETDVSLVLALEFYAFFHRLVVRLQPRDDAGQAHRRRPQRGGRHGGQTP